MDNIAQK